MQQQFPLQEQAPRRALLVSKGWLQAAVLVFLLGFFVMGLLAYATYTDEPPIPAKVIDPNGRVIFTGADIISGQEVFLRNGLMEYGSIFGHGAYLGPDYTTDYLHRAALYVQQRYGGPNSATAVVRTIREFQTNTYNRSTQTVHYSSAQAEAFDQLRLYYQQFFSNPTTINGLRPDAITDQEQIKQLTAFFSWSAWAASARRPGQNYSYTTADF
jgi:nitric oxide reductase subunit B